MDSSEVAGIVNEVRSLVDAHYLFPDVAADVCGVLAAGVASGRYPSAAEELAAAVTADLQSGNGDKHLRLLYHQDPQPARQPGDDAEAYAEMARWATRTCGGIACAQNLAGNVGYLDLRPVLFPAAVAGEAVTAAMTLLAMTEAILIDLRNCLGGEPSAVPFLVSYLWDHEPAQICGLRERGSDQVRQAWTLPHVPGRRFGRAKPVYVLTSGTTFSAAEQLGWDLQRLGRAIVVGERTRGGAHAREGFTVHPHLEATISVAAAVDPQNGGNWEGTGVTPDIATSAAQARDVAYQLALERVAESGGARPSVDSGSPRSAC
jgi:hypothetical protein